MITKVRNYIILISVFVSATTFAKCNLQFDREEFIKNGNYTVLEINDTSNLYSSHIPQGGQLEKFQDLIRQEVEPDAIALLKRQRDLYATHFPQYVPKFNNIINGKIGKISTINCLVATLLQLHYDQQTQVLVPTEFAAWIIKNDSNNKLRIYFESSSSASVPLNLALKRQLAFDHQNGWRFVNHLHNHPFVLGNPTGDIAGTLIPSGDSTMADVLSYLNANKNWGLEAASITNGFDTIEIDSREFGQL